MKKVLLGALLLLSMSSYSQDLSLHKIGNSNIYGGDYDDDDDDDDDDNSPAAPISDYLYVIGAAGIVYAGRRTMLKTKA